MKTNEEIVGIVSKVGYQRPGLPMWRVLVSFAEERPTIQIKGVTDGETWTGRKWFLSRHMTTSEIVATCFKAILSAEEHETREFFTYRTHAIYGPHLDVEALVGLCVDNRVDVRHDAMQGAA